jgi:hypothetical protein
MPPRPSPRREFKPLNNSMSIHAIPSLERDGNEFGWWANLTHTLDFIAVGFSQRLTFPHINLTKSLRHN